MIDLTIVIGFLLGIATVFVSITCALWAQKERVRRTIVDDLDEPELDDTDREPDYYRHSSFSRNGSQRTYNSGK